MIWYLIDVDIPQLSSNGIQFDEDCFKYTYSLQSSSNHSYISLSFDATTLSFYIINISNYVPFDQLNMTEYTNMIIPNGFFNGKSIAAFNITVNGNLKQIGIGNDCFGKVRVFNLDSMSELESVVIGNGSFRIDRYERSDGSYRVVNCPKLKSIQIGYGSFNDYHSFELNNLPSLQSIDMGQDCFIWTPSFSLTSLNDRLV